MRFKSIPYAAIFTASLLGLLPLGFAAAPYAGENVMVSSPQEENVYAAGSNVTVSADVNGDVVVAGGRVNIADKVSGDILAAAGTVDIQAQVQGDVRAVGGQLTIAGSVGGDAVAAGGDITLSPDTQVRGRALLAGGELNISGHLEQSLAAAGGVINISGQIRGNVDLRGEKINILPGASIDGQLNYYSPQQANIDSKAHVGGKITFHQVKSEKPSAAAIVAIGLGFVISLLIAGTALYLLFPRLSFATLTTVRTETGKSVALGLAVFVTIPFAAFLLFSLLIGAPLALITLAVYFVLLMSSFLLVALFVGNVVLRVLGFAPENSKAVAVSALALGLVIVGIVLVIPVLGALLVFIATLFALGALNINLYRAYHGLNGKPV